ncbi:maker353 [Drosophila busckii]|uniref:Maker353 n=1 Tax=Drosophila busckii TaxID=30019 RepID=A0A0M4EK93_DROBS|nr:uncharacterized protein LOC108606182 [Drosophila busckii]ALC49766.1 maker353 [Drosophila busckii]
MAANQKSNTNSNTHAASFQMSLMPYSSQSGMRRFQLTVPNPEDKCLIVRALFAGPLDCNFYTLVHELSCGMDDIVNFRNYYTDSESSATDTCSETETETESK